MTNDGGTLLVGAYERDNFGDLLFLLLTKALVPDVRCVSSVVTADMRSLAGEIVVPYSTELRRRRFDRVWVVGGEVGTTGLETALRFSLPTDERMAWEEAYPADRELLADALTGGDIGVAAYIPDLRRFPLNSSTQLVLNSVGVAGVMNEVPARRRALLEVISQSSAIRVRDFRSAEALEKFEISHELHPDLVHSIALGDDVPEIERYAGHLLVQASIRYLESVDEDEFWGDVGRAAERSHLPIAFFAAGTAHLHDSLVAYERGAAFLKRHFGRLSVVIVTERDPFVLCGIIRRAAVWLGGSLHGRVVACSYGVPRVSLVNAKVSNYAQTWDPDMPHGVKIGEFADAIEAARSGRGDEGRGPGTSLAADAKSTLEKLVADLV